MSSQSVRLNRRQFLQQSALAGAGFIIYGCEKKDTPKGTELKPTGILGKLSKLDGSVRSPIDRGVWYQAQEMGDGLIYMFKPGVLSKRRYLTADCLLGGTTLTAFILTLMEGENGPAFSLRFKLLNQCSARIRLPLGAVNLNKWRLEREGAWLKPICEGDRVDLSRVDRMFFKVLTKSQQPVRLCLTPFLTTAENVFRITKPVLPKGRLLDELGQSTIHEWHGKSRSVDYLIKRINLQFENHHSHQLPANWSRWGGWKVRRFKSNGFFKTHHDGRRWWLVDPEGCAFWSAGINCFRPDTATNIEGLESALTWLPDSKGKFWQIFSDNGKTINYLKANFIRTFGELEWYDKWAEIAVADLKKIGFNTIGNWSDWEIASREQIPYVRQLSLKLARTRKIYRDFPDVFHPDFKLDVEDFAQQLAQTTFDPALIGYFLMNEPHWGFSDELPAVGMLYNSPLCESRIKLASFLQNKYEDNVKLSEAWAIQTTYDQIAQGHWTQHLSEPALKDLEEFSTEMVKRFFRLLSYECKKVDANHLNLGVRYHTAPPNFALEGMRYFDVFSMNCYQEKIPKDKVKQISTWLNVPVLIGEWHFGALDVGLPASGIARVTNQRERGMAYRRYLEDAAVNPYCVGAHWFKLYDQSALGRYDGENYNIGFYDVCNKPYSALVRAARKAHERIYPLAARMLYPYMVSPQYLPEVY